MYIHILYVSCKCCTKVYFMSNCKIERDGCSNYNHLFHIGPHAMLLAPGANVIGSALAAEAASLAHEKAGNDIVKRSRH